MVIQEADNYQVPEDGYGFRTHTSLHWYPGVFQLRSQRGCTYCLLPSLLVRLLRPCSFGGAPPLLLANRHISRNKNRRELCRRSGRHTMDVEEKVKSLPKATKMEALTRDSCRYPKGWSEVGATVVAPDPFGKTAHLGTGRNI